MGIWRQYWDCFLVYHDTNSNSSSAPHTYSSLTHTLHIHTQPPRMGHRPQQHRFIEHRRRCSPGITWFHNGSDLSECRSIFNIMCLVFSLSRSFSRSVFCCIFSSFLSRTSSESKLLKFSIGQKKTSRLALSLSHLSSLLFSFYPPYSSSFFFFSPPFPLPLHAVLNPC